MKQLTLSQSKNVNSNNQSTDVNINNHGKVENIFHWYWVLDLNWWKKTW